MLGFRHEFHILGIGHFVPIDPEGAQEDLMGRAFDWVQVVDPHRELPRRDSYHLGVILSHRSDLERRARGGIRPLGLGEGPVTPECKIRRLGNPGQKEKSEHRQES
jgi:hypothetical protein